MPRVVSTRDGSASGSFRWNQTRVCTSESACPPRASTTQRGFAAIPVSAAAAAAPCRCASGIHANDCRLKGPQASNSVHTRPGQHSFLVSPV